MILSRFLFFVMLLFSFIFFSHPSSSMELDFLRDKNGIPLLSGEVLFIFGEIEVGDTEKFHKMLLENPQVNTVVIGDSLGGTIFDGLEIGKAIHDAGLVTLVIGECASACAFIAAGGKIKAIKDGKIGVHWIYVEKTANFDPLQSSALTQGYLAAIWDYLDDVGINSEVYMKAALKAGPEVKWLTSEEVKDIGWSE